MEVYNLDTVMTFGKYKGKNIREIYQFAPSYIEWLIIYSDDFYIDYKLFDKLPTPTPFNKKRKLPIVPGKKVYMSLGGFDPKANEITNALEFIKEGNTIPQEEFIFSEKLIEILEKKKQGIYEAPEYIQDNFIDWD